MISRFLKYKTKFQFNELLICEFTWCKIHLIQICIGAWSLPFLKYQNSDSIWTWTSNFACRHTSGNAYPIATLNTESTARKGKMSHCLIFIGKKQVSAEQTYNYTCRSSHHAYRLIAWWSLLFKFPEKGNSCCIVEYKDIEVSRLAICFQQVCIIRLPQCHYTTLNFARRV